MTEFIKASEAAKISNPEMTNEEYNDFVNRHSSLLDQISNVIKGEAKHGKSTTWVVEVTDKDLTFDEAKTLKDILKSKGYHACFDITLCSEDYSGGLGSENFDFKRDFDFFTQFISDFGHFKFDIFVSW